MLQPDDIRLSNILDFTAYPVDDDLPFPARGNNKKGIVIICAGQESPETQAFLSRVLQAVQLQAEEDTCQIHLQPGAQLWMTGLQDKIPFSRLISFGIPPQRLGYNLLAAPYQPLPLGNKTLLFAHTLSQVMGQPELKKPLWEALKQMFP